MGKGMKLLRNIMLGVLLLVCAAVTTVIVLNVNSGGDDGSAVRGCCHSTTLAALVVHETEDSFVRQSALQRRSGDELWHYFPVIPEAAAGDTVKLSVLTRGFVAWGSNVESIEFTNEPSNADFTRVSFVVPEGDFSVWAYYEEVEQEHEGVFIFNPEGIDYGDAGVHPGVFWPEDGCPSYPHRCANIYDCPIRCGLTMLSFGMFGSHYSDRVNLTGFPDDAVVQIRNYTANVAGQGGAVFGHLYGVFIEGLHNDDGEPEPGWDASISGGTLGTIDSIGGSFRVRGIPEPIPGVPPISVISFNFEIRVDWEEEVHYTVQVDVTVPLLDGNGDPVLIDGIPQTTTEQRNEDRVRIEPRRFERDVEFTILPRPEINSRDREIWQTLPPPAQWVLNPDRMPEGVVGETYGGVTPAFASCQNPDCNDPGHVDYNPGCTIIAHRILNTHDTRIDVMVHHQEAFPPSPRSPDHGTPWDRLGGLQWHWYVENNAYDPGFFRTPALVSDRSPIMDVLSEYAFTEDRVITLTIRLRASAPHPNIILNPVHSDIGIVEETFEITILPRPEFTTAVDGLLHAMDATLAYRPVPWPAGSENLFAREPNTMLVGSGAATRPDSDPDNGINPLLWVESSGENRVEHWFNNIADVNSRTWLDGTGYEDSIFARTFFTTGFPVDDDGDLTDNWRVNLNNTQLPDGLYFVGGDGSRLLSEFTSGSNPMITISGIPTQVGRFPITVTFDSLMNENLNLRTVETREFDLIVWPRTYLNITMGATGSPEGQPLRGFVRQVISRDALGNTLRDAYGNPIVQLDAQGRPAPELIDELERPPFEFLQYRDRRAVMPGSIGIISHTTGADFVRWEHNAVPPFPAQNPPNLPGVGGPVGTNLPELIGADAATGHTNLTGYWNTSDPGRHFLAIRMPAPMETVAGVQRYNPLAAPADVYISGFPLAEPPRIEAMLSSGFVGALNPTGVTPLIPGRVGGAYQNMIRLRSGMGDGNTNLINWQEVGNTLEMLNLDLDSLGDRAFLEGTAISGGGLTYNFTIGVTLPGTMRVDRAVSLFIDFPLDGWGDVNGRDGVNYADLILLGQYLMGTNTEEINFVNANVYDTPANRDRIDINDLRLLAQYFARLHLRDN